MRSWILVIVLAYFAWWLNNFLGFGKVVSFNDKDCSIIGGDVLRGSEDITHVGGGVLLVSSCDFHHLITENNGAPGNIFALDLNLNPPTLHALPVDGLPKDTPLAPHGIAFSNHTHQVYAVSHGMDKGGDTILVFSLSKGDAENKYGRLRYLRSVKSPLFNNGALNDVIEGADGNELYVTEWLQTPLPVNGKKRPDGLQDRLNLLQQKVGQLTWPGTRVFRCVGDTECTVAASGFYMANGITKNTDSSRVFVVDLAKRKVVIFSREADGRLQEKGVIQLEHSVDNIEYESDSGKLFMGSIPIGWRTLARFEGIADVDAPGGLTIATPVPSKTDTYTVDEGVLMHKGDKLPQISSAYKWGNSIVLGSPSSDGVLHCRV